MTVDLGTLDLGIVGIYLAAMILLGAILSKRIHFFKDYFLAGGMLTTPILVCSLVSTYYELVVTFAVSESGYYYGVVAWTWLSRPYYLAILIAAFFLAKRLKKHRTFMTLPDLLEHHYGLGTRIIGALACFVYSLPITAIAGMAVLFEVLGWDRWVGLTVSVGVCAIYTMMGGLWADAISDTIQFALMCVAIAVAIPLSLAWVGGFDFIQSLPASHLDSSGGDQLSPWIIVAWTIGALTVFVEPAFYQRIFAAKDSKSVVRALIIGIFLWAAYDWGVTLIGMIGRAAVEKGLLPTDLDGRAILMHVTMLALPLGLKGLFIGGVLAAAMSSIDSYGLLASGNITYDIVHPLTGRRISDRALMRATRFGVFAVMILAAFVSLWFERITDAWTFMAGVLASVVLVPVMAGLLLRKPPARAAGLASALAGFATLLAYHIVVHTLGEWDVDRESYVWRVGGIELWREYAAIVALPVSTISFIMGNLFGRRNA